MDPLAIVQLGINFGALGVVLGLLAAGRLVARSWADALVAQANLAAERAERLATAADARADALQVAVVEQTAALRAVESLVRGAPPGSVVR